MASQFPPKVSQFSRSILAYRRLISNLCTKVYQSHTLFPGVATSDRIKSTQLTCSIFISVSHLSEIARDKFLPRDSKWRPNSTTFLHYPCQAPIAFHGFQACKSVLPNTPPLLLDSKTNRASNNQAISDHFNKATSKSFSGLLFPPSALTKDLH